MTLLSTGDVGGVFLHEVAGHGGGILRGRDDGGVLAVGRIEERIQGDVDGGGGRSLRWGGRCCRIESVGEVYTREEG